MWNMSLTEVRTLTEGVWEEGAEKIIWTYSYMEEVIRDYIM